MECTVLNERHGVARATSRVPEPRITPALDCRLGIGRSTADERPDW
jgi:hypothetical protein